MSEIIIRKAEPKDFMAVQQVQLTGGLDVLTYGDAIEIVDMEMQASNPNGIFGVAEISGKIVGFIYGDKMAARWSTIHYFVISPEYRGTGVAQKLGEWCINELKARGTKYIICYAEKDNKKLINFYRHFGFDGGAIEYVEMIKEI